MERPILYPVPNLLVLAASTDRPDQPILLKDLLATRPNVYERDLNGDTCLHVAVVTSRPEYPWVVQSPSQLIQAGADPTQRNNTGYTVYDIACNGPPETGSCRRDLLLQALLEAGRYINDDRLLAPARFTQCYTNMNHAMISGGYAAQQTDFLRKALRDRLKNYIDFHRLNARTRVQEVAVNRILASNPAIWTQYPDKLFHDVLGYLQRMFQGQKKLSMMRKERLPPTVWTGFQSTVDWSHMVEQSLTAAILEFDWFRPVQLEDVFVILVDSLIEQLEDLDTDDEGQQHVQNLIEVLQNSIPSYRAMSISRSDGDSSISSSRATTSSGRNRSTEPNSPASSLSLRTDFEVPDKFKHGHRGRQESIAKTPAEYYPPELKVNTFPIAVKPVIVRPAMADVPESSSKSGQEAEIENKRQKWRLGTGRKETT